MFALETIKFAREISFKFAKLPYVLIQTVHYETIVYALDIVGRVN